MHGTQTTDNPINANAATATAPPTVAAPPTAAPNAPGMPGVPAPDGLAVLGPNGEQGVILSEEQFIADLGKESHGLHLGVLGIGLALSLLLSAVAVGGDLGMVGAIGACVGTVMMFAFAVPINSGAAFLVGKMFDQDFGTFPLLLLRVGAVTAAYTAVMTAASIVMGPMVSLLFALPAMLALSIWLIGMDMFQAMVFTMVMIAVKWILTAFVMASLASMFMLGGGMEMSETDMEAWDEYGEYEAYGDEGDDVYDW